MASLIKDGYRNIQMNIDQIADEIHRAIMKREQIKIVPTKFFDLLDRYARQWRDEVLE